MSNTRHSLSSYLKPSAYVSRRFLDLADLVPQMNPGGSGRVLKPELRNALNKHGFAMEDAEYDKLWQKYDTENIGVIKGMVFNMYGHINKQQKFYSLPKRYIRFALNLQKPGIPR